MDPRPLQCVPHFLVSSYATIPFLALWPEMDRYRVSSQTNSLENDGFQVFRVCSSFSSGFGVSASTRYTQILKHDHTLPFHFGHSGQKWKGRVSSQTKSLENDGFHVFRVCSSFSSGFGVLTSTWYTQILKHCHPTIPFWALWPEIEG